ncbi:MAG: bifunctional 2-C-methyl-D-erythritol 4-phosphate cytidylyltransferase/2-C-methyl-D-erythritol 2,4-cyclodiphosphate synthase [Proteobacteria bacterium]|nr:bifunctional 2-C-methyl-D-erythritol 4-phosphate cytidylyltransferase/2-C-methyl-D-erythritol 2,4-cyclodiphosphate synthase [Pseudomonadota bacterium]
MTETVALVVAAGRGERIGGDVPKQYLALAGRPLLVHSVAAFAGHRAVEAVRVVIHPDDRARYHAAVAGLDLLEPVDGGATRQESVLLGLESLESLAPGRVLIHDAARPAVDGGVIDRVLAALDSAPAAIPALAVSDTLKRGENGLVAATVDRAGLWRAQTPQGFRYADILAAHRAAAGGALTDDAAVAEAAGLAVSLVAGSEDNVKVTTADDLARAGRIVGAGLESRVGMGFDVHRFGPGDHVMLCGVRIGHDRGLAGHSDADAGLHALVDAVLGALGAGDIGAHFPPGDAEWADADSGVFAARTARMVGDAGGVIAHLDVTIACEQPRIGPHRTAMAARVAELFGVDAGRVSVKATTTERLGFLGRGEGVAALAVATLRLPA